MTIEESGTLGIMKTIKHIVLTAPTTGLGVGDIIKKVHDYGHFNIEDSKLRNLIYSHVWYLKNRKGYKNIASQAKKYSLRKEENIPKEFKKDSKYDDESLFIKAKNADLSKIYHSPRGIPCKIINITNDEIQIKSLITNQIMSVSPEFPLVLEEKILEKIKEFKS